MKKIFSYCWLLIVFPIIFSLSCSSKIIKLEYNTENEPLIKVVPAYIPKSKIYFEKFNNKNEKPEEIGENIEGRRIIVKVANPEEIVEVVKRAMNKEFKDMGFSVTDNKEIADKIIDGHMVKFWTTERNNYIAIVRLKIAVKDKMGKTVYEKMYSGSGKNFGRSLSKANYNETFGIAMRDLIGSIFQDINFIEALK